MFYVCVFIRRLMFECMNFLTLLLLLSLHYLFRLLLFRCLWLPPTHFPSFGFPFIWRKTHRMRQSFHGWVSSMKGVFMWTKGSKHSYLITQRRWHLSCSFCCDHKKWRRKESICNFCSFKVCLSFFLKYTLSSQEVLYVFFHPVIVVSTLSVCLSF